jgi:hypothetical protein
MHGGGSVVVLLKRELLNPSRKVLYSPSQEREKKRSAQGDTYARFKELTRGHAVFTIL